MTEGVLKCDCCFSDSNGEYTVRCTGSSRGGVEHAFCYQCVCRYIASGLSSGSMQVVCIQKRACSGMLATEDIIKLMKCAADKFEDNAHSTEQHLTTSIGTIVECSTCNKRIRKLAFYNYVSCECGTIVCYECGEDITMNTRKHPCSKSNGDREPVWFSGSISMANPGGSRRSLSRSLMTSLENATMSLVLHESIYNDNTDYEERQHSLYRIEPDSIHRSRRH